MCCSGSFSEQASHCHCLQKGQLLKPDLAWSYVIYYKSWTILVGTIKLISLYHSPSLYIYNSETYDVGITTFSQEFSKLNLLLVFHQIKQFLKLFLVFSKK